MVDEFHPLANCRRSHLLSCFCIRRTRPRTPDGGFSLFRQSTFTGAVFAMTGYGATAQVMVFYLPLFLQNAYGFDPLKAGLAMTPFALPMVLTPRLTTRIAQKVSGRAILTLGLVVTLMGNLLFWLMAHTHQSYQAFAFAMLVAGTGAGL